MIEIYKQIMFNNYANFSGRARRSEFWYFSLANVIIVMGLYFLLLPILAISKEAGPTFFIILGIILLYLIVTFIPRLAIGVRRLHDLGYSGWMYLIAFVPGGGIILLVFFCMDSQPGINRWGVNPKEVTNNYIDEIGKQIEDKY